MIDLFLRLNAHQPGTALKRELAQSGRQRQGKRQLINKFLFFLRIWQITRVDMITVSNGARMHRVPNGINHLSSGHDSVPTTYRVTP